MAYLLGLGLTNECVLACAHCYRPQDAFRGPGSWDLAMRAMERCRTLGVEVTIIAMIMRTNYPRRRRGCGRLWSI
jgi:MoaA/NifB/PqqE/SkfB family radical SAM enzyme